MNKIIKEVRDFNEKLDKKALKALRTVCKERDKQYYTNKKQWLRISKEFEKVAKMFDEAGDEYFAKEMRREFRGCIRRSEAI